MGGTRLGEVITLGTAPPPRGFSPRPRRDHGRRFRCIASCLPRALTIGSEGALVLAHSPFAARLVELDISLNDLNREAVQALVDSPYLENLRQLRVRPNNPFAYEWKSELLPEPERVLLRARFGKAFDG